MRRTRRHKPRAYGYLLRTDEQALHIATINGWIEEEQRPAGRTADEITHAERVARDAIAAMHEANRARPPISNSLRNIDAARDEVARAHAAATADKPAPLAPEVLGAIREANPVVVRALAAQQAQREAHETEPEAMCDAPA